MIKEDDFSYRIKFNEEDFKKLDEADLGLKSAIEKEKALKIIVELFPKHRPLDRDIGNPNNYSLYFGYNLFGKISFKEFQIAKGKGTQEFVAYVLKQYELNNYDNLIQIFLEKSTYTNREDFETTIAGELALARKIPGIITTDIFTKINKIGYIVENVYGGRGYTSENEPIALKEYKEFLMKTFFHQAEFPYFQEATQLKGFMDILLGRNEYIELLKGIFEKRELELLLLELFKKHITDSRAKVSPDLFQLYYLNRQSVDSKSSYITLNPDASSLLYNFIMLSEDNINDFINLLPRGYEYSGNQIFSITFEPFIPQYFGNWNAFRDFLEKQSSTNIQADFLFNRFQEFESNAYRYFNASIDELRNLGFEHFKQKV